MGVAWYYGRGPIFQSGTTTFQSGTSALASGDFPDLAVKQTPIEITFNGCPPEGQGGDPALNRLKNRVDESSKYYTVSFDAVSQLSWPKDIEKRNRFEWSAQDAASISKYEGIPIAVEGFLAGVREEGPESTNCHGSDHDFHIWLVKSAGDNRSRSIVVEVTPRVRAKHANWTTSALAKIVQSKERVRISGWLMFDQEHPEQIGNTRGTLWEIHPIMQIEVEKSGQWTPLRIDAATMWVVINLREEQGSPVVILAVSLLREKSLVIS